LEFQGRGALERTAAGDRADAELHPAKQIHEKSL
jgi:hypothetical protein